MPVTKSETRRVELLRDVAEVLAAELIARKVVAEEGAIDIGNSLADFLAKHWGGQQLYIPTNWIFKCDERDQQIFERMGRGKAGELAKEFGLSYIRVYQIYRRVLAEKRAMYERELAEQREPSDVNQMAKLSSHR